MPIMGLDVIYVGSHQTQSRQLKWEPDALLVPSENPPYGKIDGQNVIREEKSREQRGKRA